MSRNICTPLAAETRVMTRLRTLLQEAMAYRQFNSQDICTGKNGVSPETFFLLINDPSHRQYRRNHSPTVRSVVAVADALGFDVVLHLKERT